MMTTESRVSVIVTTADVRGDIVRTVRSALAQTEPAVEILVAGNDTEGDTKSRLAEIGDAVRWIDVTASTVGAQRNAAIRRCRGDLIALLDPQAVWQPTKLARSVAALQHAPQDDLLYTPATFLDPDGTRHGPPPPELLPSGWILDELFEEPWIVDSTAVFRKTVWERHGGFDETLTGTTGQNFFLRASRAHRFAVLPKALTEIARPAETPVDNARNIRESAEMLHRFYAEQGGDERLDSRRARRTLGTLCETAARLSWSEHNIPMTLRATMGAMYYHPTWRSRLFLYWVLWRTRQERARMNLTAV